MAAPKDLIARGIGFSPGSVAYIVTGGLTPSITSAFGPIITRGFGLNLGTAGYIPTAGFLAGPPIAVPAITGTLIWRIEAADARVAAALAGARGPVRLDYRFERRTKLNVFQADVTHAFLASGCSINGNNDRDIFRAASFAIDPSQAAINPLSDHIAVFADLLVDGSLTVAMQLGLFALNVPRKTRTPNSEIWQVTANDLGIHLMEATTTAPYTVAAGQNYITGTNGVKDILVARAVNYALPSTTLTLPVARTWPPGTPWLRIVNDLLHDCNMYSLWFDATGTARSRESDELSSRTADVTYLDTDFVLAPIEEEADTTRLANQVIAVVDDPARGVLSSVKTNSDPDSPTSTVTLGRTITKLLSSSAADQATLDSIATRELQKSGSLYKRMTISTQPDPRRGAHEVYQVTVTGIYTADKWWARSWELPLSNGAPMRHNLARVEKVTAS